VSAFSSHASTVRALGIDFFNGTAEQAVASVCQHGGLVVAPAAPSFVALQRDPAYRVAIADADLAIADSGWMVNFWQLLRHERISRISSLKFFQCLLETPDARKPGHLFWILPSQTAQTTTLAWAREHRYPVTPDDLYVAPDYRSQGQPSGRAPSASPFAMEDQTLLAKIVARRPKHIVVAIGGGMQDKIGSYLKHNCGYRPGIYCIGAAPAFVTGDQVKIPMWADRLYLGWIFRVLAQPRTFIPRFWSARRLPALIHRYGRDMPPLG
jgi:N-acetylglucosaminyldiphosphoundecaprenol N-acetyl-beta-D-mannosaminyltransferase